jgi:hypothetical protein
MAYQQVNLAQLEQALAARVESVPWWTQDEFRRAINEGMRIYSASTGYWRTLISVPTIPGNHYVPLPGSLVQGTRVTWNGLPLEPVTLTDLSWSIRNWRGTTTTTPGAPPRPIYWARASLTLLMIYPADAYASVYGTNTLQINGVRNTPILVNQTDYIDLGQEQFDTLLGYAQHVLSFKLGGQALVSTYPGWMALLKAAAEENRQFAKSSWYRKTMGLDILHKARDTEKDVQGTADEAEQAVGQVLQMNRFLGADRT